jgi:hypothetical protein
MAEKCNHDPRLKGACFFCVTEENEQLRAERDAAYRRGIEDAARVVADQSSAILNALADIVCMTQPEGAKVKWRSELIDREMVVTEVLKIRSAHDETRKKLRALADAPAGGGE